MSKPENIFLTPKELVDIVVLLHEGTINHAGAKKVIEILWKERIDRLANAVIELLEKEGPTVDKSEAVAIVKAINWNKLLDDNKVQG